MWDRCKTGHGRGLARCHPAEFRHFCNQHGRGDRTNPGDRPQKPRFCCRSFLLRNDAFDPSLKLTDLGVQHGPEVRIHALDVGRDVLLPARRDLRRKPLPHVHNLRPARSQTPENTQILAWQPSTGIWSELHEPGNHLGIDPVCLRPRAPGTVSYTHLTLPTSDLV